MRHGHPILPKVRWVKQFLQMFTGWRYHWMTLCSTITMSGRWNVLPNTANTRPECSVCLSATLRLLPRGCSGQSVDYILLYNLYSDLPIWSWLMQDLIKSAFIYQWDNTIYMPLPTKSCSANKERSQHSEVRFGCPDTFLIRVHRGRSITHCFAASFKVMAP